MSASRSAAARQACPPAYAPSQVIVLKGGVSVLRPAWELALALEDRGCRIVLDDDGGLLVQPRHLLTDTDRLAIVEWLEDLKRVARYCEAERI